MKIRLLFLFLLLANVSFAQTPVVKISELKPVHQKNHFPEVKVLNNPKVTEKINTFLQLINLDHLPGVFKNHPFEKVSFDSDTERGAKVGFDGWKKLKTSPDILSILIYGVSSGAYPEYFEIYYNFDLHTGEPVVLENLFTQTGKAKLVKILNQKVTLRVKDYLTDLQSAAKTTSKEDREAVTEQINMYKECLERNAGATLDYYEHRFSKDSITFIRGRCANHALMALDDLDKHYITFSYKELSAYLSPTGKQLLFGHPTEQLAASPAGKIFKGKIGGLYPVTAMITNINNDGSLNMSYWYDKVKTPIEWKGVFLNNHFSLKESGGYDQKSEKQIEAASIEADWINRRRITGTWTNSKTNAVLKLELDPY